MKFYHYMRGLDLPTRTRCQPGLMLIFIFLLIACMACPVSSQEIQFNRDIRSILSNNCYTCHGYDDAERKGGGRYGLRLDTFEGATRDLGGYFAIKPGSPDESELISRISTQDSNDIMPPAKTGKKLSDQEIQKLRAWITQGATYTQHWSFVPPTKPSLPPVDQMNLTVNPIDFFILNRLEKEGLSFSPRADRLALARRLALDLTGLPPTIKEAEAFASDTRPDAYERFVDLCLNKTAFGEHWARLWLDQARYADSAGYADDPPRTIWGYRDYVIRAFNKNKPFDLFTIEQLAGDLLPAPENEQLIATAFHRNTMTNNEGGTNDEEFRNVAVVDRVNTTYEVWMATTMACAQCHNHKYDPISQEDYFRSFAIFNNTQDADLRDERPFLTVYSETQERDMARLNKQIAEIQDTLNTYTPELEQGLETWSALVNKDLHWTTQSPATIETLNNASIDLDDDGTITIAKQAPQDTYKVTLPTHEGTLVEGIQILALPSPDLPKAGPGHSDGNFVITGVHADILPASTEDHRIEGRFIRIEAPGDERILSLAEIEVYRENSNLALEGTATQSSTDYEGEARRAIDGNTNGDYVAASTTHTQNSSNPWWELDLGKDQAFEKVIVWNRTGSSLQQRLSPFRVVIMDPERSVVWEKTYSTAPDPQLIIGFDGSHQVPLKLAHAGYAQKGFEPGFVLQNPDPKNKGWAISPKFGEAHALTLIPESPFRVPQGSQLRITIEQQSRFDYACMGRFQIGLTSDPRLPLLATIPQEILQKIRTEPSQRTPSDEEKIRAYYLSVTPLLETERAQRNQWQAALEKIKPQTTVPIMKELQSSDRRASHIQHRGNFMDKGKEVQPGLPALFGAFPSDEVPDRLDLARWLIDRANPLTSRVIINRMWETLFGIGIVRTSEDFGTQGDTPTHPELLDWLAVEFMDRDWNFKSMLKLMVTSTTYRQTSIVNDELLEKDPENQLLARGPRFRLTAESIRDQALFVGGLLSSGLYGPPVNPPQPQMGLSAAFGSGIDWETSPGEERYRRGIYTRWRRSNPYPSMSAFDAPNREVCIVKRDRTNTPLQALVTLNDPVYLEAAMGLGHRMNQVDGSVEDKLIQGFRLCLIRPPEPDEIKALNELYQDVVKTFTEDPAAAKQLIAFDFGFEKVDPIELASLTVVGNVLLNLDETFLKL